MELNNPLLRNIIPYLLHNLHISDVFALRAVCKNVNKLVADNIDKTSHCYLKKAIELLKLHETEISLEIVYKDSPIDTIKIKISVKKTIKLTLVDQTICIPPVKEISVTLPEVLQTQNSSAFVFIHKTLIGSDYVNLIICISGRSLTIGRFDELPIIDPVRFFGSITLEYPI